VLCDRAVAGANLDAFNDKHRPAVSASTLKMIKTRVEHGQVFITASTQVKKVNPTPERLAK
jgi:hypothetical protein